jgi:hypothetical protein
MDPDDIFNGIHISLLILFVRIGFPSINGTSPHVAFRFDYHVIALPQRLTFPDCNAERRRLSAWNHPNHPTQQFSPLLMILRVFVVQILLLILQAGERPWLPSRSLFGGPFFSLEG